MTALQTIAENLAVARFPLKFYGLELGTRMTVVRLGDGSLWVHSSIPLTGGLMEQLKAMGRVQYVVAPNKFHHLFAGDMLRAFPEAQLFSCPGLSAKRPDLPITAEIEPGCTYGFSEEIGFHVLQGMRYLNEVVFFHKASRTLILTDLCFNMDKDWPLSTRLMCWLNGVNGKFGCPRDVKWFFVRDRGAFRASLREVADRDFDRVIMAHGKIVEEEGKRAFREAFGF